LYLVGPLRDGIADRASGKEDFPRIAQISVDVYDEGLKDVVVKTEAGKEIYKAPIKSD
jgi:hypothetical protein